MRLFISRNFGRAHVWGEPVRHVTVAIGPHYYKRHGLTVHQSGFHLVVPYFVFCTYRLL